MEPLAVAQGYFDAWNRRDPDAIVASFAEGGPTPTRSPAR